MTKEEVRAIAEILMIADGGCRYCVKELVDAFHARFPRWRIKWTEEETHPSVIDVQERPGDER